MATPVDILALDRASLKAWVEESDPGFRADQLWRWLWKQGERNLDAMTNLPASLRERISTKGVINQLSLSGQQVASDGTIKFLFALTSGRHVETVLIPDFAEDGMPVRMTVGVSSQVGCAMGCSFCATGLMGFQQKPDVGRLQSKCNWPTMPLGRPTIRRYRTSSSWAWRTSPEYGWCAWSDRKIDR